LIVVVTELLEYRLDTQTDGIRQRQLLLRRFCNALLPYEACHLLIRFAFLHGQQQFGSALLGTMANPVSARRCRERAKAATKTEEIGRCASCAYATIVCHY
jgi:hypothetical protein